MPGPVRTQSGNLEIDGARIAYELLGEAQPGQPPVLLIHGATSAGGEDWGLMAPLLARRRLVILPDCRGHGNSTSTHSYRFAQLATDMKALVRSLGYERAHVIGHSNGGNVALVMLLEHPDVVQSAVIQAANAFVSADLLEREPVVFDPQRIAREAPQWMEMMQRLHAPVHGSDYWRELLALTLAETISQPNYTPADLAAALRPALIIQGEADPVNAPARHAQFIATHTPYAELWLARNAAHNVHDDLPAEWLTRVERFIELRGDVINENLYRLQKDRYSDRRDWIFDIQAHTVSSQTGKIRLSGQALRREQLDAARDTAARAGGGTLTTIDAGEVRVLLTEQTPWALVNCNVTDLYEAATIHSGRLSQGLIGEAVRLLEVKGEWARVRMERDGYLGWVQLETLHRCEEAAARAYSAACTHRVSAGLAPAWRTLQDAADATHICGQLVFCSLVTVEAVERDFSRVRLPDGRAWWMNSASLLARDDWPQPNAAGIAHTLGLMRRFIGTPYLWGGRSPFGYDCSGLSGAFWEYLGVVLPRDADQQRRAGTLVQGPAQPGDLLFFRRQTPANIETRDAAISHVAIALGAGRYLHASGSAWGITINSLNLQDADCMTGLVERLVDVRRYEVSRRPA